MNIVKSCYVMIIFLVLTGYFLSDTAIVGGLLRPSQSTGKPAKKFDGVWLGKGNVTLIKEFESYILLRGKDAASTWSATGIIQGSRVICRGEGITNDSIRFVYESELTIKDSVIIDKWKASFPEGKTLEGEGELKELSLEQPSEGAQPNSSLSR